MIIAIDGPAGSGKSSTARAVAERLGYYFLSTGAMYRAVALAFLRQGSSATVADATAVLASLDIDVAWEHGVFRVLLEGEDISDRLAHPDIAWMSSKVAQLAAVRQILVERQRQIGDRYKDNPGLVLEGRDIGTIVFPDADVKIYMRADAHVRASRRHKELLKSGSNATYETVLEEILQRDHQDKGRAIAPLRLARDAIVVDTTERPLEDHVKLIVDEIRERSF